MGQQIFNILAAVCLLFLSVANFLNVRTIRRQERELHNTALHIAEREKWEDETFERLDRRIEREHKSAEEALNAADAANKNCDERFEAILGRVEDLDKRMVDFDELAADNIRAQTDAEKAWAAGLQSLANFGTGIPSLSVENLNHE